MPTIAGILSGSVSMILTALVARGAADRSRSLGLIPIFDGGRRHVRWCLLGRLAQRTGDLPVGPAP